MSRITTGVGLSTGFPIADTVEQLIAVSARPRDKLTAQGKKLTDQKTAFTQLTVLTVGLQLTAARLASSTLFNQRTATSSDDKLITAKVASGASPALGQYSFTPIQTAQSQQLQSSRFASKTAAIGAGSLSLGFGGFVNSGISLDELGGGDGFTPGKIRVTDRSGATADIDLSYARSIDDVLNAINNNSTLGVRAETYNDQLRLVDVTGSTTSNLRVQDIGNGTTAASLGLAGINAAANQALGTDIVELFGSLSLDRLNDGSGVRFDSVLPDIKVTFRDGTDATLDLRKLEVKGTKATATTPGATGSTAKIKFTAVKGGSEFDDVVIRFVNNPNIAKGAETVAYDDSNPALKTLTFQVRAGQTTAKDVVAALNGNDEANDVFTAAVPSGSSGSGVVSVDDTVITSGGGVIEPVAGGSESTISDILSALNTLAPTKLQATISADGQRIELTDISTDNGGSFSVVDLHGSKVAADLGLTAAAAGATISGRRVLAGLKTSLLTSLNGGNGLGTLGSLNITDRSGASASVNLSAAETLDDVIEAINAAAIGVQASVNSSRNGIQIVDTTGATASNLIIANGDGTNAADKLGLASNAAATSKSSGSLKLKTIGENSLLNNLFGGAGITRGSFTITDTLGSKSTVNITDDVQTVGDVIEAIGHAGLAVQARINDTGDGITLIDTAHGSGTLAVAESGGTTAQSLRLTNSVQTIDINGTPTQVIDGKTTFTIDISATDSLTDLAKDINNSLGIGIRASIINDGSSVKPFRLAIFNERTGATSSLLIDSSAAGFSIDETVAARDALLAVGDLASGGGYLASSSDNTFADAVPEVTLTLKGASTSSVTVNVGSTDNSLVTAVKAFVESYNKLVGKVADVTAYNSETNQSAILQGDSTVLRLQTDLSRLFSSRISGAGSIQSLEAIGISLKADGSLVLEETVLTEKFASDPDSVKSFFTRATYGVAARVKTLGDQLAGVGNSLLLGRSVALDSKLSTIQERIDFLTAKLNRERESLLNKFYAMEAAISKMQNNSGVLATLTSLASYSNSSR